MLFSPANSPEVRIYSSMPVNLSRLCTIFIDCHSTRLNSSNRQTKQNLQITVLRAAYLFTAGTPVAAHILIQMKNDKYACQLGVIFNAVTDTKREIEKFYKAWHNE
jgi:hypothetical protein